MKHLYGRVRIDMAAVVAEERHTAARKKHFYQRMKAQGVRGTSIQKYLRRGFPGPFALALRREMELLADDFKRKWWV
jgi:hypothetical protein